MYTARRPRHRLSVPRHSHVRVFRRLPRDWPELWTALLRGVSRAALEQLSPPVPPDHDGACARSADVRADLRAVERFFDDEASTLARAIAATGYVGYPVSQRDRDRALPPIPRGHWSGAASSRPTPDSQPRALRSRTHRRAAASSAGWRELLAFEWDPRKALLDLRKALGVLRGSRHGFRRPAGANHRRSSSFAEGTALHTSSGSPIGADSSWKCLPGAERRSG